ncbi:heavy metal translocating P-type ATPase metal-binding domain-containing protein [Magnetospira sp. QH-2]|uniref:heavy metal translocating P-type ATPase metal-binding domain-containing protein n=1 Tax=Magnetospira sp. (strain QH-2) TaxID=1288970 RepID=UPI0003E81082|nr:heavy metal translocating P-type ATPase metal-binding domain-containing protein [Magnetospira sp. QH-2]CCQ72126.1 Nitrogen fixation protein fixI [Magnetospira sp. QH-2]
MADCLHCGTPVPDNSDGGRDFCCHGCEAAYDLVRGLGLDAYYQRRCIDPEARILKPDEDDTDIDYSRHVRTGEDGGHQLSLMVEGLHCAACVWLIESVLSRNPAVTQARVNMTTHRLNLAWTGDAHKADDIIHTVLTLGYRLVPFDPERLSAEGLKREKELLRAMAVAGFAAGNVMLLSVSVWAGHASGMMQSTRDLMHWLSALVVLPALVYCGRPFFRSALIALRGGHTNMDVPISLAVILTAGMSLSETMRSGPHVYFDSAIMLLFFLLIGRYLDSRARGRARASAERLLGLTATAVTVIDEDGTRRFLPLEEVHDGMTVLAAAGEKIAVDGEILTGRSDVDASMISGESTPETVAEGDKVFAGTTNLSGPLTLRVTATGEGTLLAEIVRLMESAEQGRARYVAVADRVARWYAPVVHGLALVTFLGWWGLGGLDWQPALMIAVSVLIITCPCALALAVPVVQVIASGRLMRQGILLKNPSALERLVQVDRVVFDKTGTLTIGKPVPANLDELAEADKTLAASMAAASKHPLARALCRALPMVPVAQGVAEVPGRGLVLGEVKLGARDWCGEASAPSSEGPELWLSQPKRPAVLIRFTDRLRPDAEAVVASLSAEKEILSGDREPVVSAVAEAAGIARWRANCSPTDKTDRLESLAAQGAHTMMVGDGLNDAPALAAAHVSLSPSTAVDVSQTAADVIFQGDRLAPVAEVLAVARRADRLVKQNFLLAFLYNACTIPLAVAGYVTPLIAAVAMSSSSLVVISNALRLGRRIGK